MCMKRRETARSWTSGALSSWTRSSGHIYLRATPSLLKTSSRCYKKSLLPSIRWPHVSARWDTITLLQEQWRPTYYRHLSGKMNWEKWSHSMASTITSPNSSKLFIFGIHQGHSLQRTGGWQIISVRVSLMRAGLWPRRCWGKSEKSLPRSFGGVCSNSWRTFWSKLHLMPICTFSYEIVKTAVL